MSRRLWLLLVLFLAACGIKLTLERQDKATVEFGRDKKKKEEEKPKEPDDNQTP